MGFGLYSALAQNLKQFHKKPRYLGINSVKKGIRVIGAKIFLLVVISTVSFFQVE